MKKNLFHNIFYVGLYRATPFRGQQSQGNNSAHYYSFKSQPEATFHRQIQVWLDIYPDGVWDLISGEQDRIQRKVLCKGSLVATSISGSF